MNNKRLLKILALLVLVLVLVVAAVALIPKSSPDSTSSKFVNNLLDGNAQVDYNLTTSSFKASTSESAFQSTVQYIDSECSGTATLQSDQQTGNLDSSVYIVRGKNVCHINIELQKDNSGWQVNFVNQD